MKCCVLTKIIRLLQQEIVMNVPVLQGQSIPILQSVPPGSTVIDNYQLTHPDGTLFTEAETNALLGSQGSSIDLFADLSQAGIDSQSTESSSSSGPVNAGQSAVLPAGQPQASPLAVPAQQSPLSRQNSYSVAVDPAMVSPMVAASVGQLARQSSLTPAVGVVTESPVIMQPSGDSMVELAAGKVPLNDHTNLPVKSVPMTTRRSSPRKTSGKGEEKEGDGGGRGGKRGGGQSGSGSRGGGGGGAGKDDDDDERGKKGGKVSQELIICHF